MNTSAMAQAARDFIAMNNLAVTATKLGRSDEYVAGLFSAVEHMQYEFLRQVGNATQEHGIHVVRGDFAIAFARVVYTAETKLDIEVQSP